MSLGLLLLGSSLSLSPQRAETGQRGFKATAYLGGRTTPLRAALGIASADRLPLGIVFGRKALLCGEEQEYNFKGLSSQEAFLQVARGTGYRLDSENGVFNLVAPDLTEHETKVLSYRFTSFPGVSDTMAFVGAQLSGWILASVDGAQGYSMSLLGSPDDEKLRFDPQTDATTIQIANTIVQAGSKGVWTLIPSQGTVGEIRQEISQVSIYSFHDSETSLRNLSCPSALPELHK